MKPKNVPSAAGPLVIERTLNAPVALVWQALVDRDHISQWSFEMKEFRPEVGFEFEMYGEKDGVKYLHLCKITEVIPLKKLAYTWRYDKFQGDSLVVIELTSEGNATRLKLTHSGLETLPKTPDFARENFFQGWTHIIGTSLKGFVERDGAERDIVISRVFDAPRELVWEAMTRPEHVVNWWGPRGFTTTIEEMDVRPGGKWKLIMHGPDGAKFPNESLFEEVLKPERLVFSHSGKREGGAPSNFVATWTFAALEERKTRVTIRLVFPSADARDFVAKEFNAVEGGKQTLERLGEFLVTAAK